MRTIFIYTLGFMAVLSAMWVTPLPVQATNVNYVPLAPIDVTGSEFKTGEPCRAPTCFPRYLRTLYNIGIVLAGLFAVVSIVRGGFTLMFTDSILGHSEGKGIILRALGGLVIVYSSYILMNMINPALGRDLDLALQFPRVTIRTCSQLTSQEARDRPDCGELSVIAMSQYQHDLLRKAEVANGEWRDRELARLDKEIEDLQTELGRIPNDDEHLEERNIVSGLLAIKRADRAALLREGTVRGAENKTAKLSELAITEEEFNRRIREITQGTQGGEPSEIAKARAAFQTMIDTTPLSPSQIAQLRTMEADRITSIQRGVAQAVLERPPKSSALGYEVEDWIAAEKQVSEQIKAISEEQGRIIHELTTIRSSAADAANSLLVAEITSREKTVWAQTCNNIALIANHCKALKSEVFRKTQHPLTCDAVPADIK